MALKGFRVGLVYRVSPAVGSYMVALGCAEAILEEEVVAPEVEEQLFRSSVQRWREVAADITRRRRSR